MPHTMITYITFRVNFFVWLFISRFFSIYGNFFIINIGVNFNSKFRMRSHLFWDVSYSPLVCRIQFNNFLNLAFLG